MADQRNTPRQPRNMMGLLNFLTEHTAKEDSTAPTTFNELDEERKQFLENALKQMTSNVGEAIANALETLVSEKVMSPEQDVTDQEEALDYLIDCTLDLNYAQDVMKIGGFPVILRGLQSPHASLRSKSSKLIGEICQNQNHLQDAMLTEELNVMPDLIFIAIKDSDPECRINALYGVSCLVRQSELGEQQFLKNNGFSCLMKCMWSGIPKLSVKGTFLLNYFIIKRKHTESIMEMGFVELLVNLDKDTSTNDLGKEMCSQALKSLIAATPKAARECRNPVLRYEAYLRDRLQKIQGHEEFMEEESYRREILKQFK